MRAPHDIDDIYRRFSATALRRALRFVSRHEAEEIVHDVFLRLLESPERFRGDSSPATWLYTVTTRLCIDHLRSRSLRDALVQLHGPDLFGGEDPGTAAEARAFLSSLWRRLDPDLTMIGVLYYLDGLTTAQIGKLLEVSDRTIANRLDSLTREAQRITHVGATP